MPRKTEVFISYKTGLDDGLTFTANTIRLYLENHLDADQRLTEKYNVWMDDTSLKAGEEWNQQIYNQIPKSDVLLLLIANETIKSEWVAREVDYAKGARVTVLPVLIRAGFDIKTAMERFDLATIQYVKVLGGTEDELADLAKAIDEVRDKTIQAQRKWMSELLEGRGRTIAQTNRTYALYHTRDPKVEISIAAGDMFSHGSVKNPIDVYVNSENDYLQMARIFESKTVSALLRYHGSHIDKAGRIVEDSVQEELDRIIELDPSIKTRPVMIGTVIPTSAGHPNSTLRKELDARYIFHTATVTVQGDGVNKTLECRLTDSGIRRCVRNTLETILDVNRRHGDLTPPGATQAEKDTAQSDKKGYKPIDDIIIPIFGAGHGGRPSDEIIPALIQGVKEFLVDISEDEEKKALLKDFTRIYLAALYQDDVDYIKRCLDKASDFFIPSPPPKTK
jgi:hypothetical protein